MPSDSLDAFRACLEKIGLRPGPTIIADGSIHRCGTAGKERGCDGSYVLYPDTSPSGHWWNFRTGEDGTWTSGKFEALSAEERTRIVASKRARQQTEAACHAEAQRQAARILEAARPAPENHPYLVHKGITPRGEIRVAKDGRLIIPLHDATDTLLSLQFISPAGEKRFLTGGTVRGGFFTIRGGNGTLYIAEGYATSATIREATGETVLVAFTCCNLRAVAEVARAAYPDRPIVICADNDHETAAKWNRNPGLDHATAAARSIGAFLAFPEFEEAAGKSDFNDLATAEGLGAVRACLEAAAFPPPMAPATGSTSAAKPPLVSLSAQAFLDYQFPKRECILDPILPGQGLALLYAPRGLGKTFLALTIACGVALGLPVLRWKTGRPRNVLFVDGEMQGWMLRQRLAGILKGFKKTPPDTLRIVTPDCQPDFIPNLATSEGQAALEPMLAGVELLILDNLATLCRVGKENEAESWLPVQTWILSLRRRGIAVISVHHANQNGGQRGTSAREDVMDVVIALRQIKGQRIEDGACFEVHLEKSRCTGGNATAPFKATLIASEGAFLWDTNASKDSEMELVGRLCAQGRTIREIEKTTHISRSKAGRLKQKAESSRAETDRCVPLSQS